MGGLGGVVTLRVPTCTVYEDGGGWGGVVTLRVPTCTVYEDGGGLGGIYTAMKYLEGHAIGRIE